MINSKGTVISKKIHIGGNKFISIVASYENEYVTKLNYNVYKQYGYSKRYIVALELSRLGIHGKTECNKHYGVSNSALKERAFSTFQSKVLCEELRNNIKTIIKGVS